MTDLSPVALAGRQQSRASVPTASVWVSASAGTGKTKVLTDRVLSLMLNGTPSERILCLTFTKAAAAEMANRIAGELSEWVTLDDTALDKRVSALMSHPSDDKSLKTARQLFARVLETPGGMKIQTIHAFCQSVLRRFPLEAGLAPHFDLLSDQDALDLLDQAQESTIARAHHGADEPLADALAVLVNRVHEARIPELMAELARARGKTARLIRAHGNVDAASATLRRLCGLGETETHESILRDAVDDTAIDKSALEAAAVALRGGSKTDAGRGVIIADWLSAGAEQRRASFDTYTTAFLTATGSIRAKLATKAIAEAHPDAVTALHTEADRIVAVRDKLRSAEIVLATGALLTLGQAFLEEYQEHKAAFARLDYDDLIQHTRALLVEPGVAEWVLYKLDGGLDHVLIDEAQDTSPEQWSIVQALTGEFFAGEGWHEDQSDFDRTVFAVGDRKQSIYSFQGAAPAGFDTMRTAFHDRVTQSEKVWDDVDLAVSFRSTTAVLQAVDAVFGQDAAKDGVVPSGETLVHLAARQGQGGRVEIWPPMNPEEADEPAPWKPPVERVRTQSAQTRLARLIAAHIQRACREDTLPSKNRRVHPGDIMVLVRRRTDFVDTLVRALKDLDIPVAGVDRMVLIEQMAVMDLVALGRFLLLPQDDLTLATVLKSPLAGLSETDLFDLAHGRGEQTLWSALSGHAGADSVFGQAYALLAELLNLTDFRTPFALYAHVLTAHDGRRKLLSRLGFDANDPIDEFLAQALEYERLHTPSLEGFLHWLEHGRLEVKRDLEQASRDAVRVMTVHGAKGLQAPIVYLPDTLQVPTQSDSLLWTEDEEGLPLMLWAPRAADRDAATRRLKDAADAARDQEYKRLLYVAMTRAEDQLYVCGWNTSRTAPETCWYNLIECTLEPLSESIDDSLISQAVDTSQSILRLESPQSAAPEKPDRPEDEIPDVGDAPAFAYSNPPDEPVPPKPLAPSQPDMMEPAVESPLDPKRTNRFQRGLLIHRLLQSLPDLPAEARRQTAEAFLSRPVWDLSAEQVETIRDETLAVLNHESFAPLFGPRSKAEVPLTGLLHGRVLSGQVDRLVVSSSDVMIVDYKTNRPPPHDAADISEAYVFQMAAYRAALREIYPQHSIRCVLLWTDGPFIMDVPDQSLDAVWDNNG